MVELGGESKFSAGAGQVRGEKNWQALYLGLGFTLTVGGTLIPMIEPLKFPWNLVVFGVLAAVAYWLFIWIGWFQKQFLRFVRWTEDRPRA